MTAAQDTDLRVFRLLAPLLRWRYPILVIVIAAATVHALELPFRDDWYYFHWGSRLLFGDHPAFLDDPGGLRLYANYGEIQIGPLTLLLVTVLRVFGFAGSRVAAIVIMASLGPLLIWQLEVAARTLRERDVDDDRIRFTVLFGGAAVLVAWGQLAGFWVHLDDVLTLAFGVFALRAAAMGRSVLTGVLIGLAIASKPWGIIFVPLTAAFPCRLAWRSFAATCAVTGVAWLPFLLADVGTITAGAPQLPVDRRSVLHLLGMSTGDAPNWIRPLQLGVALVLGALAVHRRRWIAVLLVGIAARVALDPGVFGYYSSGLLLAAFAWELLRGIRPVPLLTMSLFWLGFVASETAVASRIQAGAQLAAGLAAALLALGLPAGDLTAPAGQLSEQDDDHELP